MIAASPTSVKRVVVTAAPITSVDVTSADSLGELLDALHGDGVELVFAEMKDPVKDKLKKFGLFNRFGERGFFPTIESAVSDYVRSYGVKWQAEG